MTAFLDTSYTIAHQSFVSAPGADDEGYPMADSFTEPVTRGVYGWYPLSSQMSPDSNYNLRTITAKVVMVPDVSVYSPRDRIAFPGDDITDDTHAYFVSQDVRDYNTGPFNFQPGGEIVVERVTG